MSEDSTVDHVVRRRAPLPSVWVRRAGVLALLVAIGVAGSGYLGVHSQSVSASNNGYTLTVTFARYARSGLDVPLRFDVTSLSGFDSDIVITINREYFDIFETQGFHPSPSDESSDGQTISLTFTQPDSGTTFSADYDAYIQPASQQGEQAQIGLQIAGQQITSVSFKTSLFP